MDIFAPAPTVLLVRTTFDGDVQRDWLPAPVAVWLTGCDPENGALWASAHIYAGDGAETDMGLWDRSA